ncbi:MAG: hypothetical protein ACU837_12185 [Gammaproteobacteria bacterium]
MNIKQAFVAILSSIALIWSFEASAITGALTTTIIRVATLGTGTYGGCMAYLKVSAKTAEGNPACSNWVSFSCVGTYTDKEFGFQMFDNAQMALAMNKKVYVVVDDQKKHTGVCFANRIDIIQ